jgi:hypothetical protein
MVKKLKLKSKLAKVKREEKRLHKALKREALTLANRIDTAYDKAVISWTAPEYVKFKKGWIWYTIFTVLFLGGAAIAYLFSSWTFSLVLVAFFVVYMIFDRRKPKNVKVILSEVGIKVGSRIYQYGRIRTFWIIYNPPFAKTLNIRVHNEFLVDIEIQLGDQDPTVIYEFLSRKLPELEGKTESLLRHFERLFKL